jgi:hypothetical protein
MFDADAIIHAIDGQLAADEKQLRQVVEQADSVRHDFDDLIVRLRREIEASAPPSLAGAHRLRG